MNSSYCCLILGGGGYTRKRRFMENTFPKYSRKHLPGCIKTFRGKNFSKLFHKTPSWLYKDFSWKKPFYKTVHRCFKGKNFPAKQPRKFQIEKIETKRDQNYLDIFFPTTLNYENSFFQWLSVHFRLRLKKNDQGGNTGKIELRQNTKQMHALINAMTNCFVAYKVLMY